MMSKIFLFLLFFSSVLNAPHTVFDPGVWLREQNPAITLRDAASAVTNKQTRLDFRLVSLAWLRREDPKLARESAALAARDDDPVMRAACAESAPAPDNLKWESAVNALPAGEISFALNYANPGALMQPQDILALARGNGDDGDDFDNSDNFDAGIDDSEEELRALFTGVHFMRLQRYAAVLKTNEDGELLSALIVMQGIFSRSAFIQTLDLNGDSKDNLYEKGKFLIYETDMLLYALSDDFLVLTIGQSYIAQRHLLDSWMEKYARAETNPANFAREARTLDGGLFLTASGDASVSLLRFFGFEDFAACDLEFRLTNFTTGKFTARCRYSSPELARANEDRFRRDIQEFRASLYPQEDWADFDAWLQKIQIKREGERLSFESMGEVRLDLLLIHAAINS